MLYIQQISSLIYTISILLLFALLFYRLIDGRRVSSRPEPDFGSTEQQKGEPKRKRQRNPTTRHPTAQRLTEQNKQSVGPYGNAYGGSPVIHAYLTYIKGGHHLPKRIHIQSNRPLRIGRKLKYCDQVLDELNVSRFHAVIQFQKGQFFIADWDSHCGTFVNKNKLLPKHKYPLKENDLITFGKVAYRFYMSTVA